MEDCWGGGRALGPRLMMEVRHLWSCFCLVIEVSDETSVLHVWPVGGGLLKGPRQ